MYSMPPVDCVDWLGNYLRLGGRRSSSTAALVIVAQEARTQAFDGEVEVLFRPESVTLVESGKGPLTARVLSSFFLGDRTRVMVDGVGSLPLILETAASREFHAGEDVHFSVDPDALLTLNR